MTGREKRFKTVVHYVERQIIDGNLHIGDRIPSVNAFKIKFGLSRSSIFLAMEELKSRGLIEAEPAVGYYICSEQVKINEKILMLFNELNPFKEDIYRSFLSEIGDEASIDILFHNFNRIVFETLLRNANGKYTCYVLMTGKFRNLKTLLDSISGRVVLLDHFADDIKGLYPSVGQDFEEDTYEALESGLELIKKYKRIILVQSTDMEPEERIKGIQRFCDKHGFQARCVLTTSGLTISKGDLFITAEDKELVNILKLSNALGMKIGSDFGIISYNDTPVKEILAGGITTITSDFKMMGHLLATLVKEKKELTLRNPSTLIIRHSI